MAKSVGKGKFRPPTAPKPLNRCWWNSTLDLRPEDHPPCNISVRTHDMGGLDEYAVCHCTSGFFLYSARSQASAEYWKHFIARLVGVQSFGRKWTDLHEIWSTLSTLSGACLEAFWALSVQKRERRSEAIFLFFFCQVSNGRIYRFLVGQISRNLHTRRGSVTRWILSEQNFENFPVRGRL